MFWYAFTLIVVGLFAGAFARLIVPGRTGLTIRGTIGLGIVGSFVGGALAYLIFGSDDGIFQRTGLFGSIVGSVVVLVAYRALTGRGRGR